MAAPRGRNNLIIDVGMHAGEDTEYYLAKGFDVVGVEANPKLIQSLGEDFRAEIEAGRLTIIAAAIAEAAGTAQLAVSDEMTIWTSMSDEFIKRNQARGTEYHYVEVPAIPFENVLSDVGIPRYLKIDIEGLDMLCVRALEKFEDRPEFVSIESQVSGLTAPFERSFDELATLWSLGYRWFQYVDQTLHPGVTVPSPAREGRYVERHFDPDSSGLFGEELPDRWRTIGPSLLQAQLIWAHHRIAAGSWARAIPARVYRRVRQELLHRPMFWHDLHARRSKPRSQ